jgi:hypothetical protein
VGLRVAQTGDGKRKATIRRGGARNRADRQSAQLTEQHCRKLIAAAGIAWAGGTPFNRFATLAFGKSGIDTRDCVAATGDWIKLARDWFASHSLPMPWAWVQEWGRINKAHCHILFHVPLALAPLFKRRAQTWARAVIAKRCGIYAAGTTDCQIIRCSEQPDHYPDAYRAALAFKVHYMLKCAPRELETRLGMMGRGIACWGQCCPVYGKRLAVWQGWEKCSDEGRNWLD